MKILILCVFLAVLVESGLANPIEDFGKCCETAGLSESLRSKVCQYPPGQVTDKQEQHEMAQKANAYTECYAKGKDNSECCVEKGLTGKYDICKVFCNGSPGHAAIVPSPDLAVCEEVKAVISGCNSGA